MTRDAVRNAMHDYFDGLLSVSEKETIDSFLEEYPDVAAEYELLSKLINKAQSLPIGIKTPNTIIETVSDELLSQSLKKIESDKQKRLKELTESVEKEGGKRQKLKLSKGSKVTGQTSTKSGDKSQKGSIKTPLILLVIILLAVGGYFLYDYLNTNLPWQVKNIYGQYQIDNLFNKNSIDINQKLITQDSSRASVVIPSSGKVDVRTYSTIKVDRGKDGNNIVSLIAGKINVECEIDRPGLVIKSKPASVTVLAGNISASLTDQGDLIVSTGNGFVEIFNKKESILVGRDYNCKVLGNGNIGIPYHFDTDQNLVELLDKISFGNGSVADVDVVLSLAQPRDGISLLYLLKEAKNSKERLPIFLKLNELYPVIPGITQEGIMKLDKEMLNLWRIEIEWQI